MVLLIKKCQPMGRERFLQIIYHDKALIDPYPSTWWVEAVLIPPVRVRPLPQFLNQF